MKFSFTKEVDKTACLVLPLFEDKGLDAFSKQIDKAHGGLLSALLDSKDFEGKRLQMSGVYTVDSNIPRIMVIGLGKQKELSLRGWKQAVGAAVTAMQGKKVQSFVMAMPTPVLKKLKPKKAGYESVVAAELANYAYDAHRMEDAKVKPIKSLDFVGGFDAKTLRELKKGMEEGQIVAECTNLTRRLGNVPPSIMTPTLLSQEAKKAAKGVANMSVEVWSKAKIEKMGMGCFLGVAQGSVLEPKFIIMEYSGAAKSQKPTVFVGKGITFDSGGLSLKPDPYMNDMKFDMLGAATAIGSIVAAAKLKVKKNIVALIPTCENMPSGASYRPDDVLIAMNGQSVLIENTDAEGRLIMSDALCYAHTYDPKEVIDFATLTGACVVALGNERSGLFSPVDSIVKKLLKSATVAGEYLWHLPLGEEYSEAMKCEIADISNTGKGVGGRRYGGASTAAAFLQYFTTHPETKKTYPWAHIDLASSYSGTKKPYLRSGANGFGVQTMVEYLRT